ncbi:MAG: phosphatidate cytidylyltransferase [Treponema sp.]|jgi:phosphatidate cytidylyltransferase|nr:phosphatidate cytidylyltransferase [Treponema sp.]
MKTVIQRILLFVIGLPLVIGIVVLLPYKQHLALNLLVIIVSALGAAEFAGLLKKKHAPIEPREAVILGSVHPLSATLTASFDFPAQIVPGTFILGASWVLVSRIFAGEDKLKGVADRFTAACAILIYPGVFLAWIIKMSRWAYADKVILLFLLMVIANDSVAWAVGMLWGKGNQGFIPASPHKSVAGFIGGLVASIIVGGGAFFFIPEAFRSARLPTVSAGMLLGLISGVAACLGDLGESALKRSVNMKDSGTLMPGRGGILDSIDSISLAAPVYYVSYWFLFA